MAKYLTIQNNVNTSIVSGDLLGQIGFASSVDSDGGDAIKITAAISAEAEGTFNASANPAALVFSTGPDMTATGQLKITNNGHFVPLYNAQKDLGDSSNYFRTLYVSGIDFNGLGTQTLPFNDFNVAANTDAFTVVDGNTITFTGLGNVSVDRSGQTIRISGADGGGGTISGPAQSIAFFSGDGSLTGASSLTYDESLTSIQLTTQASTLTTGFYISNAQNQDGNMFQVDTFVETIVKNTVSGDIIADTGDGYVSTSLAPDTLNNTSEFSDFTINATTNSTGMLPFNIPNFNADLAVDDLLDGAKVTLFNSSSFQDDAISGYIAIYTGSPDPVIPTGTDTFYELANQVGLQTTLNLVDGGGSTQNPSESDNFTPALQQYFGLHPSNTGNIIVFWYPTSSTGSPGQCQQYSSDNSVGTGVSPRLNIQYESYSGTNSYVDKTNYVVDAQGKLRLNTDDFGGVGNQNMIYVSGQESLPCNMVLHSDISQTKIVHYRDGEKLYSVGANTPGTDWSIFDYKNSSKPIKIDNDQASYGVYRDEQVIMRFRGGKVGIYDSSPDYDLDIHGDLGVRSGIFLYNGASVGFDDTAHRIYRSGNTLMWNGSPVSGGGGGGGGMTSWDLGVGTESASTITDGDTVTFSGLNQITTTRSTNRIDIDVDLSNYYTISQVDSISGNLQTQITSNDSDITALQTATGNLDTRVTQNDTDIDTVSGLLYSNWVLSDSTTTTNVDTGERVDFSGAGSVTVSLGGTDNRVVTVSGTAGGGGMTSWTIEDGSSNSEPISDSETLYISGAGSVTTTFNGTTNVMTVSGTAGGGGTPGGSDTQVQFNDGGSFGGDSDLTWNKTTNELTINGSLNATTKSFLINHPSKEGMKLQYASLEGPENGVYVRGTTDLNSIQLPDYWADLVDEDTITVSLTPVGSFQQLYVEDKNSKEITVGGVWGSYDYVVYGERKDVSKLVVEWRDK